VQLRKVRALKIEKYFKKIFITHRYGIKNSKPSIHCFSLIKQAEGCSWNDMVYIGDNPAKDFVNLNNVGMHTIRVLTGSHANVVANFKYNAKISIPSFNDLPCALEKLLNEKFLHKH
jgi:putative hydrolase of the HAD superfamily